MLKKREGVQEYRWNSDTAQRCLFSCLFFVISFYIFFLCCRRPPQTSYSFQAQGGDQGEAKGAREEEEKDHHNHNQTKAAQEGGSQASPNQTTQTEGYGKPQHRHGEYVFFFFCSCFLLVFSLYLSVPVTYLTSFRGAFPSRLAKRCPHSHSDTPFREPHRHRFLA